MRFCEKLAVKRKQNNLSQEQFADTLGVSRQAVSKWESGTSYPDMDKIINKSIDLSSKLIKTANNYLYENKKVKILYYAFDNTPYDIGTIEEEFKYNNIPIYSKTNLEIKKV